MRIATVNLMLVCVVGLIFGLTVLSSVQANAESDTVCELVGDSCDECPCEKSKNEKTGTGKKSFDTPPAAGTEAVCPVMGTKFKVKKDTKRSEYQGRHYVFCCPGCKPTFDADPKKYADK